MFGKGKKEVQDVKKRKKEGCLMLKMGEERWRMLRRGKRRVGSYLKWEKR